jgi:hypothetical protein
MFSLLETRSAREVSRGLKAFWAQFERADDPADDDGFEYDVAIIERAFDEFALMPDEDAFAEGLSSLTRNGYVRLGANDWAQAEELAPETVLPRILLPEDEEAQDKLARSRYRVGVPEVDGRHGRPPRRVTRDPELMLQGQSLADFLANTPVRPANDYEVDVILQSWTRSITSALQYVGPWAEVGDPISLPAPMQDVRPQVADCNLGTLQQELEAPDQNDQNDSERLLQCFLSAGYHTYWWGWSVCLDRPCAELLLDMASRWLSPKIGKILTAVVMGAAAGGLTFSTATAAAVVAAGGPLAAAFLVMGLYIALAIKLNMTARGVCISGNWTIPVPGIGILGQYIWCKGR